MEECQGSRRRVLQHKAQLCLLGLAEFRDYWAFVDWMYRLFSNLLDRLGAENNSSEVRDLRLRSDQVRPDSITLPENMTDGAMEHTDDGGAAMSLPVFKQNVSTTADIQPEVATRHPVMSGMLASENFLDPFMALDGLDWYDSDTASLTYLAENATLWPGAPPSLPERTSLP